MEVNTLELDGDFYGVVTAQKPQRKSLKCGDVLRFHLKEGGWLFGRVFDDDAVFGAAVLVCVYRVWSESGRWEDARSWLTPEYLLMPPTYAAWTLCGSGLARTVTNWPLSEQDREFMATMLFVDTANNSGSRSPSYVPEERSYRINDRCQEDEFITDINRNPVANPHPPYGLSGGTVLGVGSVDEQISKSWVVAVERGDVVRL